jgi:endonuclease YncB( thermonuclease family)
VDTLPSKTRSFLLQYHLLLVAVVLFGLSAFFMTRVSEFRALVRADNPDAFASDDLVTIQRIVDGDDLMVGNPQGVSTRLRLLGLKTFDPVVSDPIFSEQGRITFDYLTSIAMDRTARLIVSPKRVDNRNRLLGQLFLAGDADSPDDYSMDIGLHLIEKGYAIVYTEFEFNSALELAYLTTQAKAREEKQGLWSNPKTVAQADAWRTLWDQKRKAGRNRK